MDQVVDIVGSLPDLTEQQIIGAFEFFQLNPNDVSIFLGCRSVLRVATFAQLYRRLYCIFLLLHCCDLLVVLFR